MKTPSLLLLLGPLTFAAALNNEPTTTGIEVATDALESGLFNHNLRFVSSPQKEFQLLDDKLNDIESSMNETLSDPHFNSTSLLNGFMSEIEKSYFDIFISLSFTGEETETLLGNLNKFSETLAAHWERLVPHKHNISTEQMKPDFRGIRVELEKETNTVFDKLFDVNRYIGSAESTGKKINKRLLELQPLINNAQYKGDPDFRMVVTLYKYLKDVARIFLDYNNLFRYPEGVMLLIEEQFNRKLKSIKTTLANVDTQSTSTKSVSDLLDDANLLFKLMPLFRDPIGAVSSENDQLLGDIRTELIRLNISTDGVEKCFVKRMRIRFEKVWYSIDWVHQYANFIYVKSQGSAALPSLSDFSVAGYLFSFADWADLVSSWNMDSLESRLISFTIRAISNELDSAEIFKDVGRCKIESTVYRDAVVPYKF